MPMSKSKIPYLDYGFNPGGFGCSKGCDGCWSKRMSGRMQCPDCREFKVHFHPERLNYPAKKKDPMAIGVQFTGELFDPERRHSQIMDVLVACNRGCQHDYIFLTQQPKIMAKAFEHCEPWDNWYKGLTIKTQADADRDLPIFLKIPGKLWLSLEPMWGPIDITPYIGPYSCLQCRYIGADPGVEHCLNCEAVINSDKGCSKCGPDAGYYEVCPHCGADSWGHLSTEEGHTPLAGVIVGCDNRASIPFDLAWARSIVQQCRDAGVKVYVKQLRIDGKLRHDPKDFPKDLRLRELPWRLRTK